MTVLALGLVCIVLATVGLGAFWRFELRGRFGFVEVAALLYFVSLHIRFHEGRSGSEFGAQQVLKLLLWTAPLALLLARDHRRRLDLDLPRGGAGAFLLYLGLAAGLGFLAGPTAQNLIGVVWLAAGFVAVRAVLHRGGLDHLLALIGAAVCVTIILNSAWEIGIETVGLSAPPQLQSFLGVRRMVGIGVHANLVGRNAALLALIAFLAPAMRRWPIGPRYCLMTVSAIVLLWSASRSSLVALAVTLGVIAMARTSWSRGFVLVGTGAILAIGAMANLGLDDAQSSYGRNGRADELTTLTGRTDVWGVVVDEIANAPLTGHGFAGGIDGLRTLVEDQTGLYWATHAHNWALQTWYTVGLIGLVLMAVAAFTTARPLFRPGLTNSMVGAIGVFTIVVGLTESPLGLLQTFLPALLWLGALQVASKQPADPELTTPFAIRPSVETGDRPTTAPPPRAFLP